MKPRWLYTYIYILFYTFCTINASELLVLKECFYSGGNFERKLPSFTKTIVPELEGKYKGEAGKIGVIGGSIDYTGAPLFSALAALKVGADLVYVLTTDTGAAVIRTYSPDLIVFPYLHEKHTPKIMSLLSKMDAIIIGPGLGRENDTMKLVYDIIEICSDLKKPIVVDADALYALHLNVDVLKNYPQPGAILTPNFREAEKLQEVIQSNNKWYYYWGDFVTVLVKGQEDKYYSSHSSYDWTSWTGGTGRRTGGQGDILSGALGTFLHWGLKAKLCNTVRSVHLAHSIAAYAAAKLTRACNFNAFQNHGRSLTASIMLNYIHVSFESLFQGRHVKS